MPETICIRSWGGIGDALLATPAFRALKEEHPEKRLRVYCINRSHYEVYLHNPYIDDLKPPSTVTEMRHHAMIKLGLHLPGKEPSYGLLLPALFYRKPAADIIAEMLGVTLRNEQLIIRLTTDEEQSARLILSKYRTVVAIHVTSHFSSNQHWPLRNWEDLVSRNPDITFVQIGLKTELAIPKAVDLRGKLSLRMSLAILKAARSFVGVCSVFSHATNAFGIPGVVLFGPATPIIWGHPNNLNLYKKPPCSPCNDILRADPCPYAAPCMRAISVQDVEEALRKQTEQSKLPVFCQ
jgi:ADP-heptose:LPS heptosyltransferase